MENLCFIFEDNGNLLHLKLEDHIQKLEEENDTTQISLIFDVIEIFSAIIAKKKEIKIFQKNLKYLPLKLACFKYFKPEYDTPLDISPSNQTASLEV